MYKDCEKKTLSELLGDKLITAPTVFECISARTVELCGYPAMILSGAGMSYCMNGMPDIGLINEEEVIYLTTRLTNYTPLPVIVNAGAFYGDDPVRVYHICSRLVKAGADAIVITDAKQTDGNDRKFDTAFIRESVSETVFYSRIKAAVEATKNTKCLVIAESVDSIEYAVEKTVHARKLGAAIACVASATSKKDAEFISNADKGLKMWPIQLKQLCLECFIMVIRHWKMEILFFMIPIHMMDFYSQEKTIMSFSHSGKHGFRWKTNLMIYHR